MINKRHRWKESKRGRMIHTLRYKSPEQKAEDRKRAAFWSLMALGYIVLAVFIQLKR